MANQKNNQSNQPNQPNRENQSNYGNQANRANISSQSQSNQSNLQNNHQAVVHYHFKPNMIEQGIKFLEAELVKKALESGCQNIVLLQNERDPSYVIGIATWTTIEEAKKFQSQWNSKETELATRFCSTAPTRELFKPRAVYSERARKAA